MSYLTTIQTALVSAIDAMEISTTGYNYTYSTVQQEDFTKSTFPLVNVYLMPNEEVFDLESFCINESRKYSRWQLHCYNKAMQEGTLNKFLNNYVLFAMLHDIKRMIGNNYTLNGICEGILYRKSYNMPSGLSDDIFIPEKLVIELDIPYTETIY